MHSKKSCAMRAVFQKCAQCARVYSLTYEHTLLFTLCIHHSLRVVIFLLFNVFIPVCRFVRAPLELHDARTSAQDECEKCRRPYGPWPISNSARPGIGCVLVVFIMTLILSNLFSLLMAHVFFKRIKLNLTCCLFVVATATRNDQMHRAYATQRVASSAQPNSRTVEQPGLAEENKGLLIKACCYFSLLRLLFGRFASLSFSYFIAHMFACIGWNHSNVYKNGSLIFILSFSVRFTNREVCRRVRDDDTWMTNSIAQTVSDFIYLLTQLLFRKKNRVLFTIHWLKCFPVSARPMKSPCLANAAATVSFYFNFYQLIQSMVQFERLNGVALLSYQANRLLLDN